MAVFMQLLRDEIQLPGQGFDRILLVVCVPADGHTIAAMGGKGCRSTLQQDFEQLHWAWSWSGLARFGPTTQSDETDGVFDAQ